MEEKIIKARLEAEAGVAPNVLKKDVYEAGVDAGRIIDSARREAQSILDEAERRRDAEIEAARQEGYEAGLAHWNEALLAAQAARDSLQAEYETELVKLAVQIARKIIGEELRTHPEAVVGIVRESLRSVRHERSLTIQVNPKDLAEVQPRLDRLQEAAGPGRHMQVVPDPAVSPGGCIVESDVGIIDARLETQLKCLEEILLRTAVKR
jgi:type III secretion protein L